MPQDCSAIRRAARKETIHEERKLSLGRKPRLKMVYRIYSEKKASVSSHAAALCADIRTLLGIPGLERLRVLHRYDAEGITKELFDESVKTVFSEPVLDDVCEELPDADRVFAVEYLPGQFDQRADSAAQCIRLMSRGERPEIRTAEVYLLYGNLTDDEFGVIKKYVINPVEAREAALGVPETLRISHPEPAPIETLDGFTSMEDGGAAAFIEKYSLAMDCADVLFCRDYFASEKRDPTMTEIRMIDTYWSDHCRHTTFLTTIDSVRFEDKEVGDAYERYLAARREQGRTKDICLMDIATAALRSLKAQGKLPKLDESEEINACTVKFTAKTDGGDEDWLLLFKNETHNHPTEIEPFGGAATCIGGAIRDPLSGRAYVYSAMRVTGAADPRRSVAETIPGKLPQRKIVTTAADGYSSYGNQIGLATGQVREIYHDGYAAKRMEIGAVIAAAPAENVRRERPVCGDVVILVGGRTGRDGCGGATGSSKSHTKKSLEVCGAEVQKGNAPEERKLQRLFASHDAARLIKRCNDFGAGGVSVAIGELADGLDINLDLVTKKYDGLGGTELAISESQERMAVVCAPEDAEKFIALAGKENLEATVVARVTDTDRLTMTWRGTKIVDLSRDFINSNGAPKHIGAVCAAPGDFAKKSEGDFTSRIFGVASDLNSCSQRGLAQRFDSTIGASTVLMPFGGKNQITPTEAMVNRIFAGERRTKSASFMSWGFNPFITEKSPYHGAYLAVVESVAKLIAAGASFEDVYLTFQEYFEKPGTDERRWGKPLAALLGAFDAQNDLGIASVGGKDSMSGSFEKLDVPPTLCSFAVTTGTEDTVLSPEFKGAGHRTVWLRPRYSGALPVKESFIALMNAFYGMNEKGDILAASTVKYSGCAGAVMEMAFGNSVGFDFAFTDADALFGYAYGSFVAELRDGASVPDGNWECIELGTTSDTDALTYADESVPLGGLLKAYDSVLEDVFPVKTPEIAAPICDFSHAASERVRPVQHFAAPRALIPVFPGTNCEFDTAQALSKAGAVPEVFVINNLTAQGIADSVSEFERKIRNSQMIIIPGGFSGGDEPEGSGKFITAFFRNGAVADAVNELLKNRDGLMCGICNGFQALIKLGLVPFGEITPASADAPTLTYNVIGRHQSGLVRTRIASNKSPWLAATEPGQVYTVAISHGEGRFIASDETVKTLAAAGQIATQYADAEGHASYDIRSNPNGSVYAIEGITSPDGRVIGKMGHVERSAPGNYRNVDGEYDMHFFESGVKYFG